MMAVSEVNMTIHGHVDSTEPPISTKHKRKQLLEAVNASNPTPPPLFRHLDA